MMVTEKTPEEAPQPEPTNEVSEEFLEDATNANPDEIQGEPEPAPESTPETPVAEAQTEQVQGPEAPTPAETPALPTPPDTQRQEIARLRQENERYQQLQAEAQVEASRTQYQQNLEYQGQLPETASLIADNWAQAQKSVLQHKQQLDQQHAESQAKTQAANMIAKQFGVTPDVLMPYDSPEAMQAAARKEKEIVDMRARLSKLEGNQVPAQDFSSPTPTTTSTSRDKLMSDAADGKELTETEWASLFQNP